jgi:hypothetical protein
MGSGAGEEGLEGEEAERLRVASLSAWSSEQSGGLPGSPGRRGALELGVAPASSNKGRRESERLSGRLWRHSSVAWDKRSFGMSSGSSGTAGGPRVVCGESVAGELERRSEKPREDVWEVSVGGVSSMASSGCLL